MSVRVEGLNKRFGSVQALADFSIEVPSGTLLAVVGPSGCGKTTLLRIVAGLEAADSGRVYLFGEDVTALPPEARGVGLVFQNYALFPHMTVGENVAYGLRRRGIGPDERKEQVRELLALVNLEGLEGRMPHQLSAGQQQRVAIARALAPRPRVLLLDEPLAALDAVLRVRLREEIRRLQKRLGITTIFVTHDQEEALAMADEVAVMRSGRLEQLADPWTLYDRPSTPFVASFVGQSNRFRGRVGAGEIELEGVGPIPKEVAPPELQGAVLAVVRPECLRIVQGPGADQGVGAGAEGSGGEAAAAQNPVARTAAAGEVRLDVWLQDVLFLGERCKLLFRNGSGELVASAPGERYAALRGAVGEEFVLAFSLRDVRWIKVDEE